jgi:hypothetical protein
MAQFDLFRHPRNKRYPFLLDLQADLLHDLATRVVAPLTAVKRLHGKRISRLNPIVEVEGTRYAVLFQELAALPSCPGPLLPSRPRLGWTRASLLYAQISCGLPTQFLMRMPYAYVASDASRGADPGLVELESHLAVIEKHLWLCYCCRVSALDRLPDLLRALNAEAVQYVLFGGQAVNLHGILRFTDDIDLFVSPAPENVERLRRALRRVWTDPSIEHRPPARSG